MSSNKDLLIDTMATQAALHFVISVLSHEQKETLKTLVSTASNFPSAVDASDEIKGYLEEMHLKVQEIIEIGTSKLD